jgi:hypothetical protein
MAFPSWCSKAGIGETLAAGRTTQRRVVQSLQIELRVMAVSVLVETARPLPLHLPRWYKGPGVCANLFPSTDQHAPHATSQIHQQLRRNLLEILNLSITVSPTHSLPS